MSSGGEATYDGYAEDYRDFWGPVIAPAAVRLLDRLAGVVDPEAPATFVDIGAGHGTLALGALERWARSSVIGVDPSARMLEIARERAREAGSLHRLSTEVGEAAKLPLGTGIADVAVSSFVIQLVRSRAAALREAFRILRPGGVFACLTWRVDDEPFEPEDVFDDALEALRIDPPARGGGVGHSYPSPSVAAGEVRRAGFRSVSAREEWLEHQFTPQSFVDVAEHWTEEDVFASLEEPMRVRLRAEVVRRLERLDPEALVWRRPLVTVVGRRPG